MSDNSWFARVLSRGGGEVARLVRSRSANGVEEREGTRDEENGSGEAPGGAEEGRDCEVESRGEEEIAREERGFESVDCGGISDQFRYACRKGKRAYIVQVDRNSHCNQMFPTNL